VPRSVTVPAFSETASSAGLWMRGSLSSVARISSTMTWSLDMGVLPFLGWLDR
jgi:hypothetical protein